MKDKADRNWRQENAKA